MNIPAKTLDDVSKRLQCDKKLPSVAPNDRDSGLRGNLVQIFVKIQPRSGGEPLVIYVAPSPIPGELNPILDSS